MWRLWVALVCLAIAAALIYILLVGELPYGGGSSSGSGGNQAPIVSGGPALFGSSSLTSGRGVVGGSVRARESPSPGAFTEALTRGSAGGVCMPQPKGMTPFVTQSPFGLVRPTPPPLAPAAMPNADVPTGVPLYAAPTFPPIGAGVLEGSSQKIVPTPNPEAKPSTSQEPTPTPAPQPQTSVFPTWTPYAASSAAPR